MLAAISLKREAGVPPAPQKEGKAKNI